MEDQENDGRVLIPLDGSFGAGPEAEVTIVTKGEEGQQVEKTYLVPYFILSTERLQKLCDMNFYLGYKVVKSPEVKANGLRELGL